MPIQSCRAPGVDGTVEVFDDYAEGLADLDGFSHIQLLYYFHKSSGYALKVVPFLDTHERGVFATRAPRRPNGIGLSTTRLIAVENTVLHIRGVDMLDGTPLLDIKPYVSFFDEPGEDIRTGWLTGKRTSARRKQSDKRFR